MFALRDIPDDLWTSVRRKATSEQWPVRALLLQLLSDYVDGKVAPSAPPPPGWDPARAPKGL